jgi:hypothetical protein
MSATASEGSVLRKQLHIARLTSLLIGTPACQAASMETFEPAGREAPDDRILAVRRHHRATFHRMPNRITSRSKWLPLISIIVCRAAGPVGGHHILGLNT